MPQNKFALARYRIIDSMLRNNDYVKTSTIALNCFNRIGFHVSQRTIQQDIEAMRYDSLLGYNAPISYCSRLKAYYYEDRKYMLYPFSFSQTELTVLENIIEVCPFCDKAQCHDTLCNITEKIKFHMD
jgi:predicted DNA-binding transcriptional regulator YafY